jgi:predicted component of type VI protein secretion system
MGKLTLKFGERILQEVPISAAPITVGRALDSDIQIDNPAVSHHHARIDLKDGRLVVEDLGSANGVLLNGSPVAKEGLRSGDAILIGKHVILVDQERDVAVFGKTRKVVAPRLQETFVVGVRKHGGAAGQASAVAEVPAPVPAGTRVPSLVVVRGKADQSEYVLSFKLAVIGKSPMATVRMRGWFAPDVAAQINRREDGYYLTGATKRPPKLNGQPVSRMTRLSDGDRIELKGLVLEFVDRD